MADVDMSSRSRTALVTGASGGIGLELARVLAADGYNLALVARSGEKLRQIAQDLAENYSIQVTVIVKDLSSPTAPEEILQSMDQKGLQVDLLVNNAGFGTYGPFYQADLAEELQMIAVNVTALTHLTRLFLPRMVARGSGKILNVASTAAFQPGPLMAVYYATKAYVLSFSEALSNELKGTGVTVTALCPGATASGFQSRARMETSRLFRGRLMDAATVARIGYAGLKRNKTVVIPGLWYQFMALGPRLLPRDVVTALVRRVQEQVAPNTRS